ncbi:MAG: hypothetical protein KGV51_08415 [Moraxellaceae bacterium]|nr:hypothetical protein [Moraxellaceae bacterium]
MINQSIHFEVTGNDANNLLTICQNMGKQPVDIFRQFIEQLRQPYNQETIEFLLSDDKNKQYQRFANVDELFADLDDN